MSQDMSTGVFFGLLIAGLLLFGAEAFVPGGVLGLIGGLCLVAACVAGFVAFPGYGPYVVVGVLALGGVAVGLWIWIFPRTGVGRRMTVSRRLSDARVGDESLAALIGQSGAAVSDLRPAGFARIGERRVDVVTQGGMIVKGERVRVVVVEGNRVVVARETAAPDAGGR